MLKCHKKLKLKGRIYYEKSGYFFAVISLFIGFTIPSYAHSGTLKELNGYELSITRFSAKLANKSDEETGKDILRKLGMCEEDINGIPKDRLEDICNSKSIRNETEYGKIDKDGNAIILSKEQFEDAEQASEISEGNNIQPFSAGDSWQNEGQDSLFIKGLFIYETKNAPPGTFGIMAAFQWKNFLGQYRGEDIFSLSGEGLVFDRSSFLMHTTIPYTLTTRSDIIYDIREEDFTADNISDQKDLQGNQYAISFNYNLPNNLYTPFSSLVYTEAKFLMMCSARLQQSDQRNTFNVYANCFHQSIGLGSVGVSVNVSGASVSVSPAWFYSKYQIMTSSPITYQP